MDRISYFVGVIVLVMFCSIIHAPLFPTFILVLCWWVFATFVLRMPQSSHPKGIACAMLSLLALLAFGVIGETETSPQTSRTERRPEMRIPVRIEVVEPPSNNL